MSLITSKLDRIKAAAAEFGGAPTQPQQSAYHASVAKIELAALDAKYMGIGAGDHMIRHATPLVHQHVFGADISQLSVATNALVNSLKGLPQEPTATYTASPSSTKLATQATKEATKTGWKH
jgi:hypothetical protein